MRLRVLFPLVTAVPLVMLVSGAETQNRAPDFKALMRKVLDRWETLDPAKVAPFYSQQPGRLFFDIAPLKYAGWNQYAEGAKQVFADWTSLKFTLADDAQAQQRGDFAWGAVTVRTDVVKKDGTKQSFDARWTTVWEKHGQDWVIAHDHYSVPAP